MSEHHHPLTSAIIFNPRYLYKDTLGKVSRTNITHVTWEDIKTEVSRGVNALCSLREQLEILEISKNDG